MNKQQLAAIWDAAAELAQKAKELQDMIEAARDALDCDDEVEAEVDNILDGINDHALDLDAESLGEALDELSEAVDFDELDAAAA